MDLAAVRSFFPGTRDRAFLDAACVSLMPIQAAQALQKLLADLVACPHPDASTHHIALDASADEPRRQVAALINARPEDIALVESTTHGLQVVAASVPLARGDRVLVGETDFLGLAVPWIARRDREGFEIVTVPHREGRLTPDDFDCAANSATRLVLLSSVQWSSGFRADLAGFSDLARRRGWVLVVDAIQHLGALPLDVRATPVDFVVCGGHKWLNAPAGRGFLYVAPHWRQAAGPPCPRGYLHIRQPAEGWAEYFATPATPAVRDYDFVDDARAFELGGTANYPGNVVLGAAVGLLNTVGPEAIERHVLDLGDYLIEGLDRAGAVVVSPREGTLRSGIISFTLGDGVARDRALLQRLWDERVVISHRYTAGVGGLRVSVHLYNNREDIDRLLDAVRRERTG
jgi:selenocysteine lyase/cysteine desulfurase